MIVQYTEVGEEYEAIKSACDMAERPGLLDHINETIRDQESDMLKKISQYLWQEMVRFSSFLMYLPITKLVVRQLDLTVPTRYMVPRKSLKQGTLLKAASPEVKHSYAAIFWF
jgi:hypothetical protein